MVGLLEISFDEQVRGVGEGTAVSARTRLPEMASYLGMSVT
jgi:hypothetical protein